jgi:hypothetical protein
MTIHTSSLDPGAAYTVWWFIYNNPEECAEETCADADFANPLVQATHPYLGVSRTDVLRMLLDKGLSLDGI